MDRGRVGEDRGSKETDRCPLTIRVFSQDPDTQQPWWAPVVVVTNLLGSAR
jgi:hypothetical protein